MKKQIAVVIGLLASQTVLAETLTCMDNYSHGKVFLTAKIISNTQLEDVKLPGWITSVSGLKTEYGSVHGKLNDNNRSPYKGNNEFDLNGDPLYLPTDLSAKSLKAALAAGIGRASGKGENGVLVSSIVNSDGDGAGNHKSYRLTCTSDKK